MNDYQRKKKVQIIVPFLNEEQILPKFYKEVSSILKTVDEISFSFIFVDDGSQDRSIEILTELRNKGNDIKIISLSRNFGKENALTAGIQFADADAIIFIDADLQHPPQLIPQMISLWNSGAEIVIAIKEDRSGSHYIKSLGAKFFYYLVRKFGNLDFTTNNTDFRLIDRIVVEELKKFTEQKRIFRGLIDWLGFKKEKILFTPNKREDIQVRYSYKKLFELAVNGITSFSTLPLLTPFVLSPIFLLISIVMISFQSIKGLSYSSSAFIIFLLAINFLFLGVIGIYLSSIFNESKNRPLFVIRKKIGFD